MIVIGEKINTIRKNIALAIENRDVEHLQKEAIKQVEAGIDVLDINVGSPFNEEENMKWAVRAIEEVVNIPLCIDSSNPDVIRAGLEVCKDKKTAWANSITLEQKRMGSVLPLVKEYNCPLVALCMDKCGVPTTAEKRVEVARHLMKVVRDWGIDLNNLYLDCLIEPISVGSGKARQTLTTIRMIKDLFPQIKTAVCLSAVSFGLPGRRLINRTFLPLLIEAGVDAVFLDPLDEALMATLRASNALLDKDESCLKYIKAYREGKLNISKEKNDKKGESKSKFSSQ
jgi:cobalamin-dependent methionine synthase I